MKAQIAAFMRKWADRMDPDGAPRYLSPWSFTIKHLEGIRFRTDGRGCPLAYVGEADHRRRHTESDTEHAIVDWVNGTARFGR